MNQFDESFTEFNDNDAFNNINENSELIDQSVENIEYSIINKFENEDFHQDCNSDLLLFDTSIQNDNDDDSGSEINLRPSKKRRIVFSESEDEDVQINNNWSVNNGIFQPKIKNFSIGDKEVGPNIPPDCKEPLDFFKLFVTNDIVKSIITNSNKYAKDILLKTEIGKYSIWNSW